jgi:hypothetical protein
MANRQEKSGEFVKGQRGTAVFAVPPQRERLRAREMEFLDRQMVTGFMFLKSLPARNISRKGRRSSELNPVRHSSDIGQPCVTFSLINLIAIEIL